MHPLVRGAAASAVLFAIGSLDRPAPPPPPDVVPPAGAARRAQGTAGLAAPCGPRTVPEGDACVPLPALGREVAPPAGEADRKPRARGGDVHERIPRRPDRPADPAVYAYPIGAPGAAPVLLGADDVDRPDRAGDGFDLAAQRGERVSLVALEGQEGDAEVAFVGELFGTTVATVHDVEEAGRSRQYLVLYGHLDRPGPGVVAGARLAAGEVLGFAGDSGSPGVVQLHLEVRKVRDGASLAALDLARAAAGAVTIPCDPRNVLPLRP
ncbi:MAG: M23 family metallopeptidase [Polyangiaceae bacterium]|nr:M23 family metallopeptidase [Polyangiaceae bacterium]